MSPIGVTSTSFLIVAMGSLVVAILTAGSSTSDVLSVVHERWCHPSIAMFRPDWIVVRTVAIESATTIPPPRPSSHYLCPRTGLGDHLCIRLGYDQLDGLDCCWRWRLTHR